MEVVHPAPHLVLVFHRLLSARESAGLAALASSFATLRFCFSAAVFCSAFSRTSFSSAEILFSSAYSESSMKSGSTK